jgi:hypothetical protein
VARHNGADGKLCAKGLETIREAPRNRTAHESQRGCRPEHDPELLGREPPFRKKGRQERRGKAERAEKRAIKHHKSKQCAVLDGHGRCWRLELGSENVFGGVSAHPIHGTGTHSGQARWLS